MGLQALYKHRPALIIMEKTMTFKNHTIKFNNPVWVEDFEIQDCSNQDLLDYFWKCAKDSKPHIHADMLDMMIEIDRRGLIPNKN